MRQLLLFASKNPRVKMRRDLRKKTLSSIRSTALDGIREIKARLHSITLSAGKEYREEYSLDSLKNALGNPWFDSKFHPEDRGGDYKAKYIKRSKNFQINLFVNPKKFRPFFQIEIHHKTDNTPEDLKRLLINIDELIPEIRVKQVEYAVDQCCYSPIDVENLFWVERFSLYVRKKEAEMQQLSDEDTISEADTNFEDEDTVPDEESRTALIWHLGDKDKIYERGDDGKKEDKTWDYYDFNRVRLEHTSDRRELKRKGINTLKDLINNPKFYDINRNIWDFRKFKEGHSRILIKEWEDRAVPFQYLLENTELKNPTQYSRRVEELLPLKLKILDAMKLFDEVWSNIPID